MLRGETVVDPTHSLTARATHDASHRSGKGASWSIQSIKMGVVAAGLRRGGEPERRCRPSTLIQIRQTPGVSVASVLKSRPGTGSAFSSKLVRSGESGLRRCPPPDAGDSRSVDRHGFVDRGDDQHRLPDSLPPTVMVISVGAEGANPCASAEARIARMRRRDGSDDIATWRSAAPVARFVRMIAAPCSTARARPSTTPEASPRSTRAAAEPPPISATTSRRVMTFRPSDITIAFQESLERDANPYRAQGKGENDMPDQPTAVQGRRFE